MVRQELRLDRHSRAEADQTVALDPVTNWTDGMNQKLANVRVLYLEGIRGKVLAVDRA